MISQLHYYCSATVFISLVEKQEIWLTALSHSNDRAEGTWMLEHWLQKFDRWKPENRQLRNGARILVDAALSENTALGICFSEERDLLSQWRGYASNGAGICVSFDAEKLTELSGGDLGASIELCQIAYGYQDDEKLIPIIKKLADTFIEDAKGYSEDSDGTGSLELTEPGVRFERYKEATRLLFCVKNGAFREEKEWRLLLFENLSNLRDIQHRIAGSLLSPYARLKLSKDTIVGATLGPTNPTSESVVEDIFRHHGINGFVRRSSASYRS